MNPEGVALPKLSHLGYATLQEIYEPADDTYLFVDTLHAEKAFLNDVVKPSLCLEIGGGSGCVTAALSQVLQVPAMLFITDVNPIATEASSQTLKENAASCSDVIRMNLADSLVDRLEGKLDVLLFNPPYVVTPHEEVASSMLARAWAGGENGREVLDKVLPFVPRMLAPNGVFYVVAIEENKPEEILTLLKAAGMKSAEILTRRTALNEKLMILKAVK